MLAEKIETLLEKNIYSNKEISLILKVSIEKVNRIEDCIIYEERAKREKKMDKVLPKKG